jgi:hypothetical protein
MSALLRGLAAVLCLFFLASCQEDGAESAEQSSIFPDLLEERRLQCAKDGGRWGAAPGRQTFVCFTTNSDANAPCSRETDCEGLCLARSRTCAPFKPFFGCHEVFSPTGLRQTRCIQ